jgi:hypothetical protein
LGAQRSAGTAGWAGWLLTLAGWWHDRTTLVRYHARITSLDRNHTQHMTTLPTTGEQHHERSYYTGTTSTGTTRLAPRARTSEIDSCNQNGIADHVLQPPNGLPFSRAALVIGKAV